MADKMRTNRLVISVIGALLALGYLLTSLVIYYNGSRSYHRQLREEVLPLSADLVNTTIQKATQTLIHVSEKFSEDIVLRELLSKDDPPKEINNYIRQIQQAYDKSTITVVAKKSQRYYSGNKTIKAVSSGISENHWFHKALSLDRPYEIQLIPNSDIHLPPRISIIRKLFDRNQVSIGALRFEVPLSTLENCIATDSGKNTVDVYLVDMEGEILFSNSNNQSTLSSPIQGIQPLYAMAYTDKNNHADIRHKHTINKIQARAVYMEKLDAYVLVRQRETDVAHMLLPALFQNLLIFLTFGGCIAAFCALSLKQYQTRLDSMATTDKLTLLTNRHAFEPLFEHAIREADRNQSPLTIALFDVDQFKELNDIHGHLAGDAVLISIAESISRAVRRTDCLCRWAGEEFLLLLNDCSLQSGMMLVEKIRKEVEETTIFFENDPIHVQVSIGIVEKQKSEDMEWLLQRIEQAVYQAKNNGRNRVETI
ncbi:sensor domain-containing diguanylate cyclase [Desulfogranum japonicum]|uniref:sensor domain-containing diguanylate cyclase n=1 Tax=Desulfogranum japonicum TaxID=231447 RepID=UPI00040759D2|nr:sensor domain-containing diguanylate cyclase [Desulfogranum japonicum]